MADSSDEALAEALVGIVQQEQWMKKAACRGMDPGAFILSRGRPTKPAMDACARCTVTEHCDNYQKRTSSQGIWAGEIHDDEVGEDEVLKATEVWVTTTLDARPRKIR